MPDHYFDQEGVPGKITLAKRTFENNPGDVEARVQLLSTLYSAHAGQAEWRDALEVERFFTKLWLVRHAVRLAAFSARKLTPDQCDVVSTVLLRLYTKVSFAPVRWRSEQIATTGIQKGREKMAAHTWCLLHLTLAATRLLEKRRGSAESAIEMAAKHAPQIISSDQKARVYRRLALLSFEMGDWGNVEKFLIAMKSVDPKEFKWHDTADKNEAAEQEINRSFR